MRECPRCGGPADRLSGTGDTALIECPCCGLKVVGACEREMPMLTPLPFGVTREQRDELVGLIVRMKASLGTTSSFEALKHALEAVLELREGGHD